MPATIDEAVASITKSAPHWKLEDRARNLLPFLDLWGDPLYVRLLTLPEPIRTETGIDLFRRV